MIYKLFENCIIVKGYARCMVLDLQRNSFDFVPISLANLFTSNNTIDMNLVIRKYDKSEHPVLDEYISFLLDKEYVYEWEDDETINLFPPLSTEWDYSASISNVILDINETLITESILKQIFRSFDKLNTRDIQIRLFGSISVELLNMIIHLIDTSSLGAVSVLVSYKESQHFIKIVERCRKISSLVLHSSPENRILVDNTTGNRVFYVKQSIDSSKHCGIVHHSYFVKNIEHYTESLHHNTCLNRKIAIDAEGNIKNCPSMKESFGNIQDTTLEEAINKPGFKKYWNITKDQITKCKDCEFRHVCTDCRAYIDNPDDIYSAPLKCGYDPYTCTWEEWSTNPLKQKAIDYYGMRKIVNNE